MSRLPNFSLRLITIAVIWALAVSGAQNGCSIAGTIFDPQSNPIPAASIALFTTDGEWKTIASKTGTYSFEGLAAGDYLLQADAPGFSSYRVEHVHIESGRQLTLNLNLAIATVQEQVSVTASSTPQAVDQVSKSLTVVDSSAIEQRQDYSLTDAVRVAPGVRVQQLGGPGAFSEIRVNGMRAEDTSVLVDGLRLRDPSSTQADASSLIEDFLVTDSTRIEILRGSGSSLYGTNAIGGVVNVITDPGGGPTHGSIQLEGGGLALLRGSGLVAGGSSDDRVQYSAGFMLLDVIDGIGGDQPARTSSVQDRVAFRLSPATQVVARLYGADSFSKLTSGPVAIADYPTGILPAIPLTNGNANATYIPSQDDPDYTLAGRFASGALSLIGQPTSTFGYRLDYQVVDSGRRYGNGPGGPGYQPAGNTQTNYSGLIQTLNAQANLQAWRHNLITGGYEFENESFSTQSSATLSADSDSSIGVSQRSNAAFVQDQVRVFGDRLYFAGAFRAQFFSLEQPHFTPAASAPYQSHRFSSPPAAYTGDGSIAYFFKQTHTKIRSHVGRGYRAPSLYERFGAGYDPFFGYSVYGDPLLRPEQSISVDAGIDQSFLRDKLRISGTYFYAHLQRQIEFDTSGLISPATDPYGRFLGYLNTSGGLSRGVELNTDWAVNSRLTASAAYTYTDARERNALVPNVYRSFITPEHMFNAFIVQRFGRRMFFDFALNASTSYLDQVYSNFSSGAFRFPGYHRADIAASYRLPLGEGKALRFFGKAENLFNETYFESGYLTEGVTGRGGLQFEF